MINSPSIGGRLLGPLFVCGRLKGSIVTPPPLCLSCRGTNFDQEVKRVPIVNELEINFSPCGNCSWGSFEIVPRFFFARLFCLKSVLSDCRGNRAEKALEPECLASALLLSISSFFMQQSTQSAGAEERTPLRLRFAILSLARLPCRRSKGNSVGYLISPINNSSNYASGKQ